MTSGERGDTMGRMTIRGHFDGHVVVLDEPACLAVGQRVRLIVDDEPSVDFDALRRRTDESLKPTRDAFIADGMTDDELAEFLEAETHAMRGIPYESK